MRTDLCLPRAETSAKNLKTQFPVLNGTASAAKKRNSPTEIDFVCCECNRLLVNITFRPFISSSSVQDARNTFAFRSPVVYCTGLTRPGRQPLVALSRSDETRTQTLLPGRNRSFSHQFCLPVWIIIVRRHHHLHFPPYRCLCQASVFAGRFHRRLTQVEM